MSEKRNKTHLHCTVNGKERDDFVKDNLLLADYLREELGLTGTKIGCDGGECGCCTVLIDGVPQHACLRLAATCQEVEIETIETISEESRLSALQRGFHEKLGTQCGFCTPGMIMAAEGLLRQNSNPTVDQIRRGLASNICRCTGYIKIIESVQFAVEELNSKGKAA
jgi:4-hydroxybenzoyl-CoA reductase subunit gamma